MFAFSPKTVISGMIEASFYSSHLLNSTNLSEKACLLNARVEEGTRLLLSLGEAEKQRIARCYPESLEDARNSLHSFLRKHTAQ